MLNFDELPIKLVSPHYAGLLNAAEEILAEDHMPPYVKAPPILAAMNLIVAEARAERATLIEHRRLTT
jgi:hypothetical protein